MHRRSEAGEQQAICTTRSTLSNYAAAFVLCFGWTTPAMVGAQNQPAQIATQPLSSTAYSQNQTTFTQQIAHLDSASARQLPQYTLPENECSADFWNRYEREDAAITQSAARVQQSPIAEIDPADTVQELPEEVIDPAQRVQAQNGLVQSQPRVQQLAGEVIKPVSRVQEHYNERLAAVPSPDPDFPPTGTIN